MPADTPRSVYFYTFHRCASTLFSELVLPNAQQLEHVDYASMRYDGRWEGSGATFVERGCLYGPIRVPAALGPRRWEKAVCQPDFVRDKRAIFMVRDPRDILVSMYYSTAFSHPLSPVEHIRERQSRQRERVRARTLDQDALERSERLADRFERLIGLAQSCAHAVVLRYEDLIDDWERFAAGLTRHLSIRPEILAELHARSRPRSDEDIGAHRRSGKTGGFREKLQAQTIAALNDRLSAALVRFGYGP